MSSPPKHPLHQHPFAKPGFPDLVIVPVSQMTDRWTPFPQDQAFIGFRRRLVLGTVPLAEAMIHRDGIDPFSDYRPRLDPWYTEILRRSLATNADAMGPYVYPIDGDRFMMSDDYLLFYTLVSLKLDWIPCVVMGDAKGPHVFSSRRHRTWDELDARDARERSPD